MSGPARRALRGRMVDRCRVTDAVVAQAGVTDLATGEVVFTDPPERYVGPAAMSARASSRGESSGVEELQADESVVRFPLSAPPFRAGQIIEWLESKDPTLVGAEFEVIRAVGGSVGLSRRVVVRRRVAFPFPE